MKHHASKLSSPVNLDHLSIRYEPECGAVWAEMRYPGRPCMTPGLLRDLRQAQETISRLVPDPDEAATDSPRYQILSSESSEVFNLGGDLAHFVTAIRNGNAQALFDYAKACIDILYHSATGYGRSLTTIALVRGEALGGGFEAALSSNVLIAERNAKFGFPETLFGLFPGMGAFSFLARRLTPAMAKRVIQSGNIYSAEELYRMGVVDTVVPDGAGIEAVYDLIRHRQTRATGFRGLDRVMEQFNPIAYDELLEVISIWVETAMSLSDKNLRLMEYLLRAQEKRWGRDDQPQPERAAV